jgi:hypothetical protein
MVIDSPCPFPQHTGNPTDILNIFGILDDAYPKERM